MKEHLHRPRRYLSMGEPDGVFITCRCGKFLVAGTWWFEAPPGWDPIHWKNHGHRKIVACDKRWNRHIAKIRRHRDKILARKLKPQ